MGKSIRKKRSFRKHRINPRKSMRKSSRRSVRKSMRKSMRKSVRKKSSRKSMRKKSPRRSVRKSMRKSVRKKSSRRSVRKSVNYNQKKYNLIGGTIPADPTNLHTDLLPSWIQEEPGTDEELYSTSGEDTSGETDEDEESDEQPEVQQIIKKAPKAYGKAEKVVTTEERGDNSPPLFPSDLPAKVPMKHKITFWL